MLSLLRARASLLRTAAIAALAFSLGSTSVVLGLVVDGVVEACYNNATGVLRLATATKPCLTDARYGILRETPISWNQGDDAEAAARAAADTTLQNNIDAEAAARAAADSTLQSNIDAEAAARATADTTLQSNIDAEAAARAAADSTLQSNIDAEAAARVGGDAATLAAAKVYTDGKLVSPNGLFSLSVTNGGIVLSGPSGAVTVGGANIVVSSPGSNVTVSPAGVSIQGAIVSLNGACGGVARQGTTVLPGSFFTAGDFGGPVFGTGTVGVGSLTVLTC